MNWYCVHTKPLREGHALQQLSSQLDLEVYFPQLRRQRTIRRVRREVVEPLFPRYLFCRFDLWTQFRAVRYARDVIDIVSFGDHPAVVGDELITDLQAWANQQRSVSPEFEFAAGDDVQIIDGPMQGLHATILQYRSDSERVAVLLSILGRDARMTICPSQLMKVS